MRIFGCYNLLLSGEFRGPAPSSILHATAATSGTCPFPAAWLRSCRLATPSPTRSIPGSVSHQRLPEALATCPILPRTFCFWRSWWRSVSQASTHVLSRSCGAPQLPLPITHHRASYRTEARLPRTLASPPRISIGEFSTKTKRGRTSHTIRNISRQRPERAPSIPAPLPASDKSWQGNPPQTMSAIPFHGLPSKVVTSSQMGKGGRIPSRCRWMRHFLAYGLISTAQTGACPRRIPPRIPPPQPANRCSSFIRLVRCSKVIRKTLNKTWEATARKSEASSGHWGAVPPLDRCGEKKSVISGHTKKV